MKKFGLLLLLLLVACSAPDSQVAPEQTATSATAPTEVAAAPTDIPPPPAVTDIPTVTREAIAPETDPPAAATEPQQEPSATEEPVMIDGLYEGTYFRGRADAPITMIDYSDFL